MINHTAEGGDEDDGAIRRQAVQILHQVRGPVTNPRT